MDRRINLTAHIARAYGDPDPRFMTITRIEKGSVRFSWTNNSLPTDRCPRRQLDELSGRMVSADSGEVTAEFRDAMRPYQLLGAGVTPLGACAGDVPPSTVSTTAGSTTERVAAGPVVSGLAADDRLLLVMIVAACVIGVLLVVLIAVICVCCCRRRRRLRSEKQRRAAADELSCANKGIPVIFADELLDDVDVDDDDDKTDGDDTPASTLKRRGAGGPDGERRSYKPERDCFVHFLLLAVCWPSAQVHETVTFLLITLPNIHRFKKNPLTDSAINLP